MTIDLSKYWKERYEAEERRRAKSDEELERQLDAIYKQHIAEIQKEIDAFWQRYADKNGITKLEAKKRADKLDMDVVSYKAKQLVARAERMRQNGHKVTQKDFTKAENDLMKLYNLKMKTSRLEVLQANLKLHQYELAMNELEATERHLIEAVRQENLYSSGILRDTLGSYQTAKTSAETIVYANFHGSNWASKIWDRQDALRSVVKKGVADTVLRGKGTQLLIKQLEKEFKVSNSYARRLAVTETARVYSEAQKANYKANDFERYEVLAESGACNICKPYDEKHYKTDDMIPGHNAPPFHPNCRCTTVPYLERDRTVEKEEEEEYNYIKTEADMEKAVKDFGAISDEQARQIYEEIRSDGKGYIRTSNAFTINKALRIGGDIDNLPDDDWDTIGVLQEVIESNRVPYNIRGARKVNFDWVSSFISNTDLPKSFENMNDLTEALKTIKGHTYTELGFSSVSTNPEKNVFKDRRVWLDIEVPKDANAYMSRNFEESEFILGLNSTFELKDVLIDSDKFGKVLKMTMRLKKGD